MEQENNYGMAVMSLMEAWVSKDRKSDSPINIRFHF